MAKNLTESLNELKTIELSQVNEISMNIAREAVQVGFDTDSLAEIAKNIADVSQERMRELGCNLDKPEHFILLSQIFMEISLYLGINIGRNS